MTCFKKLWTLVLSACGKDQSLTKVLLNLLEGRYQNVAVQMSGGLEAKLRQGVREGKTEAEVRAALEKLLGAAVPFSDLGDGQKGERGFDLIFCPGSDSNAAAHSAFIQWNRVFASLPADGRYHAALAMMEGGNGYYSLVEAAVVRAGAEDAGPQLLTAAYRGIKAADAASVQAMDPGYHEENGTCVITGSDGLQNLYSDLHKDFAAASIRLDDDVTLGADWPADIFFCGQLDGNGKTITLTGPRTQGLFKQVTAGDNRTGTVENVTVKVEGGIANTDKYISCAGAIAGCNYGRIIDCHVDLTDGSVAANATVTDSGAYACAGGIAGDNDYVINNCTVSGGSITANVANDEATACAGGLVGLCWSSAADATGEWIGGDNGRITAQAGGKQVSAGGEIGKYHYGMTSSAGALAGTKIGAADI